MGDPVGAEILPEDNVEHRWVIDEDGIAHCPHCNTQTIVDEYTGKPILFRHCPECGKFLNGPGVTPAPTSKGVTHKCKADKIVRAVNGTMSLSDLPLTEEDKSRIRHCVEHPSCFDDTLKELIRKHQRDGYDG